VRIEADTGPESVTLLPRSIQAVRITIGPDRWRFVLSSVCLAVTAATALWANARSGGHLWYPLSLILVAAASLTSLRRRIVCDIWGITSYGDFRPKRHVLWADVAFFEQHGLWDSLTARMRDGSRVRLLGSGIDSAAWLVFTLDRLRREAEILQATTPAR
jgi:hypothetical protein